MQTLLAISILCFLGILWAALALAREIKASQVRSLSFAPTLPDFKHHLLAVIPDPLTHTGLLTVESSPIASPPTQPTGNTVPIIRPTAKTAPPTLRTRMYGLNQSVHDIAANKQWILPSHPVRTMRLPVQRIGRSRTTESALPLLTSRKPPQPASHTGVVHRLDPAYFNKDLGDLTDPYQPSPRLRATERSGRN
jgi:hypothetical protein